MPLPLKDRKIGAIEYVIKRIKGSDSYDKMKEHNEGGPEKMVMREKPECDYKIGMKQSVQEMMGAVERKDAESFERSLRSFVSMMLDAHEDDKEMLKKDEMEHMKKGEG